MIEIIASMCLLADAARCKDVTLSFVAESVNQRQCFMVGQVELAKWVGEHPGWRVERWQCAPAGRIAKI